MRLPDNYFRELSMAGIVSKVSTITLAEISRLSADELLRIGWLGNPAIDILYSITSAGVWVARTDASGLVTEANSTDLLTYVGRTNPLGTRTTVKGLPSSMAGAQNAMEVYAIVEFTSNAGGNIDVDQVIKAAVSSYFGVARMLAIWSKDVGGGSTPTLYFSTTSHDKFRTLTLTVAGDYQPVTDFENIPIYQSDDNEPLVIDTDSNGLGNTKSWVAVFAVSIET
jgi:hypothetical protein